MKASSGINALAPEQSDSPEVFRDDTLRSGGGLSVPELVDTLVVRRLVGWVGEWVREMALLAAVCSWMCMNLAAQQAPAARHTAQGDSRDAVGWLEGQGIDLSGLVQLGGHSKKRTHTSSRGPVGFSIMKALLDRQTASERIEVIASANVRVAGGRAEVAGVRPPCGLLWRPSNTSTD